MCPAELDIYSSGSSVCVYCCNEPNESVLPLRCYPWFLGVDHNPCVGDVLSRALAFLFYFFPADAAGQPSCGGGVRSERQASSGRRSKDSASATDNGYIDTGIDRLGRHQRVVERRIVLSFPLARSTGACKVHSLCLCTYDISILGLFGDFFLWCYQ